MAHEIKFYKDKEKKVLEPALFSTIAEEWSKAVHESAGGKDAINKRTQIRKFYDEILRLYTISRENPEQWENFLPFVNMVISKAVYAQARNKVSEKFVEMLKKCIQQIQTLDDLEVFTNFFESFMGYYRQYGAN